MKRYIKKILSIAILICTASGVMAQDAANAQTETTTTADDILVLPPLFEYPVAPEDLSWTERSNWLVEHFWDSFDFKQKSVGQSQLVHAFRTYIVPMHMADRDVALAAVKELVKKIKKKPGMLLQFTQAAERTLYEPSTAELMIDEVYVEFLRAITTNKKISELRRARYAAQLASLEHSLVGMPMPEFSFTDRTGKESKYTATGVPTIIEFGDFDCADCRIARLRLETDSELQALVAEGKARIFFISPDVDADTADAWKNATSSYPENWAVGRSEGLEETIDLRIVPSLYIISADGKIVSKSANTDTAREYVKNNAAR